MGYEDRRTSILGPFHVEHDTEGVQTAAGLELAALEAGSVLIGIITNITEDFNGITDGLFTFDIGVATDDAPDQYSIGYSLSLAAALTAASYSNNTGLIGGQGSSYFSFRYIGLESDKTGTLRVVFDPDGANTQGEMDIYALIAIL